MEEMGLCSCVTVSNTRGIVFFQCFVGEIEVFPVVPLLKNNHFAGSVAVP